jgi:predicted nucleic acid-binding Zn ribbon protein
MDHIKNLLGKRVTSCGLADNIEKSMVIEDFNNLLFKNFGTVIKKKAKPLYIKNKILTVACLSSVIIQELNFRKAELIESINLKFGRDVLKDIKFIV